ncbi:hypothetical protein OVA26_16345 [Microbacterium sp. SL62]|uniref:hypothetical protein n=1 Tax=Microbacterium sp. SL62 TaxID=2995139 RepID=UPI002276C18A|nr:hypothetical protein [Microbacterium sp. SL62]MCY1718507.1 hypothetical protein [Microbacterium sp. SL62]
MAEPRRNLNIPMYDVRDAPGGTILDDDVIDVEVVDATSLGERLRARARGGAESVAASVRNVRLNGAWDSFFTAPADERRFARGSADSRARARQAGRDRRRDDEQRRRDDEATQRQQSAERARLEREARMDPIARLRLSTARAGEAYMESLRASGILEQNQSPADQRQQLSGLHQVYASMMVLQCVGPLKQGLSGQNIVATLGMAASMWAMSPDFRAQLGSFVDGIGPAIREKIDRQEAKKDDKARSRFDKLASKGKEEKLGGRWRRRLERIEFAERGHRLPFTAESAAMTEVALAEAAYADMRRPGADASAVNDRYVSALANLYGFAEADGIAPEQVSRAMRVVVGQRLEREPGLASVFNELGHGRFAKSEPREVYDAVTMEPRLVWTGDFVDGFEGKTISSGSFSVRPKMSPDEHMTAVTEILATEMAATSTAAEMNDVLTQYVVAASAGEYPDVVDELSDTDARRRFGKARTMFSSMKDDGLSAEQQHFAYSSAYVDAVEMMQLFKPDLAASWVAQYGENWQEKVAEDIARFKNMGANAARGSGAAAPENFEHFTASSGSSGAAPTAEDIVDAEVVDDDRRGRPTRPAPQGAERTRPSSAPRRPARRGRLEQPVYEGDLLPADEVGSDDDIIDVEIANLDSIGPGRGRAALLPAAGALQPSGPEVESEADSARRRMAVAKIRRARVNQHYNEVQTGSIMGIGKDDAAPLQDVDFELG